MILIKHNRSIEHNKKPSWDITFSNNDFIFIENLNKQMFCTLPSVSRPWIADFSSRICSKFKGIKFIYNLISLLTPYIQIISATFLLILPTESLLFQCAFAIQLIFCLVLFIISDLSWITEIYAVLVGLFAFTKENYPISVVNFQNMHIAASIVLSI